MSPSTERESADEAVLPQQTSDDQVDRSERDADADDAEDLERFLRDVPPHHGS